MSADLSDVLVSIVTFFGSIATIYVKHRLDKRKRRKDPLIESVETDQSVLNKLGELMDDTGSDRVCILEFHNGGKFYNGRSMQKYSMSYEVCKPGVSHEQMQSQNILLSTYSEFMTMLVDGSGKIAIDNVYAMGDGPLKNMYKHNGTVSAYANAIKSLDGKLVGVLMLNFTRAHKTMTEGELAHVAHVSDVISGYL